MHPPRPPFTRPGYVWRMEPLIVGCLTAATAVVGVAFWQVLVRPESMLALWGDGASDGDGWFDHHPGALRALRYALGMVLFMSGFLTGLALTFLLGT
ncbi:MAG: hypothetical protein R3F59_01635 [Myxococcota bacterium]